MTNKEIVRALRETAALIELTGGNSYRANAFNRAARSLRSVDTSIQDRLADGTLTDVNGIGEGMAGHIAELVESGSFELRDELLNAVPPGLLDVLRVKGLGTKKVRQLWEELGISSLDELEDAARNDRIQSLSGFGAKTQQNILENVRLQRRYNARRRYADAVQQTAPLLQALRTADAVHRAEPTGALRRKLDTVEQADLLVATDAPSALADAVVDHLDEAPEESGGILHGRLPDGLPVRIHVTDPDTFGSTWWSSTGSEAHVEAFTNAYGAPAPAADEANVFDAVSLPVIPPELREGSGELDAASNDALPSLITVDDLRGSLHNHSTYSDGAHSLRQMADAAREMGLSYFGICDHSQSLKVASGMTPDEVAEQQDEIHALNAEYDADDGAPFRVFSGIESDILKDGSLDYEADVLASFDFVVASVHTGFNMTEAEATERVITAVENPYTRILGHPTGRLLLVREGYPLDHERVIDACAANDVAIELNANPYRLDLDWRWVRHAVDKGVLISINPDAHAMDELKYVQWGVEAARKGWLTADACLNAKSLEAFSDWLVG